MKCVILMGSPRKEGNTAALSKAFAQELNRNKVTSETIYLYDKEILPCTACRHCQQDWSVFGCSRTDDMAEIFSKILNCDLLVLASPIYSWYCTPPMKASLDRLVYGMNKYYGDEKGPSLWEGKRVALITTCGYPKEKGADLWEAGMKRYCKHSQLDYRGMLAERDMGYKTEFMDSDKRRRAVDFAAALAEEIT